LNYWIEDCSGWLCHQPAKMKQMTERLLVAIEKMETNQGKMMANLDA
jgi:hypothetical protein